VDFIELFTSGRGEEIDLEEIRIPENSKMVGKSVPEIEDTLGKLRIVALKRNHDPIRIVPRSSSQVHAGDSAGRDRRSRGSRGPCQSRLTAALATETLYQHLDDALGAYTARPLDEHHIAFEHEPANQRRGLLAVTA
jgi:TrkA-C domain